MKIRKIQWGLSIIITMIQQSVQYIENNSRNANKFLSFDEADKFVNTTLTLSKLLESCEATGDFGVVRDCTEDIYWSQGFLDKFALVQIKYLILGGTKIYPRTKKTVSVERARLNSFVVFASSAQNLEYMLYRQKSTKWRNFEGLFIILDSATIKNGCKNAESFLRYAWRLDLLQAVFFCPAPNGEFFIYTYNPYTNRAPPPWQEVVTAKYKKGRNTWTLYSRKLINNETRCKDLKFDKAAHLDGHKYTILATHLPPPFSINENAVGEAKYSGIDSKIHFSFLQHINATASITISKTNIGYIEPDGTAHGLLANVSNRSYDLLINSVYNFNKYHATMTYPHITTGLAILTKYTGLQSEQSKILRFMNPFLVAGILIVAIVTIFVLGILDHYGLPIATLEVARLMTNTTMTRKIQKTPLRIYLFPIFMLFLITNATFQCKLSAILTRPLGKFNINNLEELKESGRFVYASREYEKVINDTLTSNIKITDHWNCTKYVMDGENNACLADRYELMKIVIDGLDYSFYLSLEDVASLTSSYVVRPDWPLRQKLEEFLGRLSMTGILELWKQHDAELFVENVETYQSMLKKDNIRTLMLRDLQFAFFSLLIGLICSIFVFFVECMIAYYEKICDGRK